MRRALVFFASAASLSACRPAADARTAQHGRSSGGAAGDEQRAHGIVFRVPRAWRRAAAADAPGREQWSGGDSTLFEVGSDAAIDASAHERNLAAFRARAAQSGWEISAERAAPTLGDSALSFEVRIPAQRSTLRLPTWSTVIDRRLAVISCAFDASASAVAQPQCDAIFRSIERGPRASAATELTRVASLAALSVLVPSSWTAAPQGQVQVFVSRDAGERQIALSMALSPAETPVAALDATSLRQRLSANGRTVSEPIARTINGVDGLEAVVEQPQLRRAAVSQRAVILWNGTRSVAASCFFRSEDRAARAQCESVLQSIERPSSPP
ncbi:MAG: hypothetical protein U0269_17710 [Polyangiales bacterium]